MSSKIPVLLTKQQIDYIMGHATSMELKAIDANRAVSQQFYVDLFQAFFDAKQDADNEREVELNYERGAA
jgi:hypothetical protein